MKHRDNIVLAVLTLVVLWFAFSTTVYRFRHPKLTDTELFLNMGEAVTFRK